MRGLWVALAVVLARGTALADGQVVDAQPVGVPVAAGTVRMMAVPLSPELQARLTQAMAPAAVTATGAKLWTITGATSEAKVVTTLTEKAGISATLAAELAPSIVKTAKSAPLRTAAIVVTTAGATVLAYEALYGKAAPTSEGAKRTTSVWIAAAAVGSLSGVAYVVLRRRRVMT